MLQILIKLHIVYQFAHLLGDTVFLNSWMLNAKNKTIAFPIFIHSLIHAILFSIGALMISWVYAVPVFVFTLASHFIIDICKSWLNRFPIYTDMNRKPFWTLLLIDQTLHQLVIIYLTWVLPYQIYNHE